MTMTANNNVRERIQKSFTDAAKKTGVPVKLLKMVAAIESSGRPDVTSETGAQGVMQIMPKTKEDIIKRLAPKGAFPTNAEGWDTGNVEQNVLLGAYYLKDILGMKGIDNDWERAMAAYNIGPGNRWIKKPNWKEDKRYSAARMGSENYSVKTYIDRANQLVGDRGWSDVPMSSVIGGGGSGMQPASAPPASAPPNAPAAGTDINRTLNPPSQYDPLVTETDAPPVWNEPALDPYSERNYESEIAEQARNFIDTNKYVNKLYQNETPEQQAIRRDTLIATLNRDTGIGGDAVDLSQVDDTRSPKTSFESLEALPANFGAYAMGGENPTRIGLTSNEPMSWDQQVRTHVQSENPFPTEYNKMGYGELTRDTFQGGQDTYKPLSPIGSQAAASPQVGAQAAASPQVGAPIGQMQTNIPQGLEIPPVNYGYTSNIDKFMEGYEPGDITAASTAPPLSTDTTTAAASTDPAAASASQPVDPLVKIAAKLGFSILPRGGGNEKKHMDFSSVTGSDKPEEQSWLRKAWETGEKYLEPVAEYGKYLPIPYVQQGLTAIDAMYDAEDAVTAANRGDYLGAVMEGSGAVGGAKDFQALQQGGGPNPLSGYNLLGDHAESSDLMKGIQKTATKIGTDVAGKAISGGYGGGSGGRGSSSPYMDQADSAANRYRQQAQRANQDYQRLTGGRLSAQGIQGPTREGIIGRQAANLTSATQQNVTGLYNQAAYREQTANMMRDQEDKRNWMGLLDNLSQIYAISEMDLGDDTATTTEENPLGNFTSQIFSILEEEI